ncbi:hypothetical protein ACH436_15005 [Isoptericola sp. NPDC019693]|uniref:hypothetical protein n=1 Tax=Isoptericola sp. NPDC019693 TaxID=3364009 RepID=UPI0037B82CC0
MSTDRRRRRVAALLGIPLAVVVALTTASVVHRTDALAHLTPTTFDLQIAASEEAGWQPADADWREGRGGEAALDLELTQAAATGILPDRPVVLRFAVRNTAAVAARITLGARDLDPGVVARDAALDLYDVLVVTVHDGGTTLADAVPAADLAPAFELGAGEHVVLDVRLAPTGDAYLGASTRLALVAEGASL